MPIKKTFFIWAILMIPVTGLFFLIYAAVQQNYRQSANDPQIQMAEDAAALLEKSWLPAAVVPKTEPIDIKESLAPFIIVLDDNGEIIGSSAKLENRYPIPPSGVFAFLKTGQGDVFGLFKQFKSGMKNESRLTWQPETGVRIASVIVRVSGTHPGFVLAGRSLRETEKRTEQLAFMVLVVWVMAAITIFAILFLAFIFKYEISR